MSNIENQVQILRRELELLKVSKASVFSFEPKNPTINTIWVDPNAQTLKTWDGKNWIIASGGTGVGNSFILDVIFTVSDYRTISWDNGTITLSDTIGSTPYSINNGSFVMTTTTYFYWQKDNPNAIQTTTTPADTVSNGGLLIAIGYPNSDITKKGVFKIFGGVGGTSYIDSSQIVDGTITSNLIASNTIVAGNIASNTITANKMSITDLSAISANLGTITAGNITLNTSGFIRGGQTSYNNGNGFYLGYDSSSYKFSIGNSSGSRMTWDGSTLNIIGTITTSSGSSINGTYLTSGSVTYDKITVSSLSALSANLGTVTAGTITGTTINTTINSTDLIACHLSANNTKGFWVDQSGTGDMIQVTAFDDGTGYRGIINIYDGGVFRGRIGAINDALYGNCIYIDNSDLQVAYGYDLIVGAGGSGTARFEGKMKIPVGTNLY